MRSFDPLIAARALWQMRVRRRPFVLSHGITSRCNLRCPFCSYWKDAGPEMSTPAIMRMLEEARAFGIGVYNAWTAEPLLREDLPAILGKAKAEGLVTSLVTNGVLLARRVEELRDLDYLSVSFDGEEATRDLRGVDPKKVLSGIDAAKRAGHDVLINCVISERNLDEVVGLVGLAEEMGALISFEPIQPFEMDKEAWEDLRIRDLSRLRQVVERLIELKRGGAPIINSITYLRMVASLEPRFRCHAGDIIMHVAADGTLRRCRGKKEAIGDVSEGLFRAWDAAKLQAGGCDGCLFFGYVENSLLYDLVPEVLAHYRWM